MAKGELHKIVEDDFVNGKKKENNKGGGWKPKQKCLKHNPRLR